MKYASWFRAICLLAVVWVGVLLAGCTVELYSELSEQDANEMLAALEAEGLSAHKQRGNAQWSVEIDQSQLSRAVAVLRNNGLPQEHYASLGEVFQRKGLVATQSEERMRYIHAVTQELALTLRSIDGVLAARVHVVLPASDPSVDKVKPSSAVVFIKHRHDADLRALGPVVKDLVARSIEGLTPDQVALTLVQARTGMAPTIAVAAPPLASGVRGDQAALMR